MKYYDMTGTIRHSYCYYSDYCTVDKSDCIRCCNYGLPRQDLFKSENEFRTKLHHNMRNLRNYNSK